MLNDRNQARKSTDYIILFTVLENANEFTVTESRLVVGVGRQVREENFLGWWVCFYYLEIIPWSFPGVGNMLKSLQIVHFQ